jgi:hypothetical protein
VTESIFIRAIPRGRLAKLHFAAAASLAYVCTLPAHGQEDEQPAPSAEAEAPAEPPAEAPAEEPAGDVEGPAAGADEVPAADVSATGEAEASEGAVVSTGGGLFESGAATGSRADSAPESGDSFDIGGYTRADVFVGVVPGTGEVGMNAAYGEVSLQLNAKKGAWGSAFADMRLRAGQQLNTNDVFLDLREAYVNAYLGPIDLRLGKQIVVWGRADAFNPTSNITPVDFRIRSPIEDDRRVGNIGARMFVNLLPVRIEAVWMPLYEPTIYPDVPLDPVVEFTEPSYPSLNIRNGTWAGRLHLELPSFETSVSYLYGEALLPGFALAPDGITAPGDDPYTMGVLEPGEVRVTRTSYNHHVVGADFSTAIGDLFGLRGEAAFRSPVNQSSKPWTPKPDMQWVVGIDREFGEVMIIAQYLGRYVFDWEQKHDTGSQGSEALCCIPVEQAQPFVDATIWNSNQMLFSQLVQVQSLASLRIEWKTMHEKLSLSALGLVNFNTKEWLLMPKIGYQITGGLSAYVGGEIFMGPDGTLFNMIEETLSAGYVELRMTF